jgi:uncharacterized membrane protein YdbT with pleckstrin-like domain
MDLHPSEHELYSGHPSWRSTLGFYLKGLLLAIVAGAIVWFAVDDHRVYGVLVAIAVFVVVLVVGFLRRLGTHYVLTNERLHIRRGLLARDVQETRLARVQNVNTRQTVLERLLRVGTVDFDTAGTEDSDFAFHGLAHPAAVAQAVDRAQRELSEPAGLGEEPALPDAEPEPGSPASPPA